MFFVFFFLFFGFFASKGLQEKKGFISKNGKNEENGVKVQLIELYSGLETDEQRDRFAFVLFISYCKFIGFEIDCFKIDDFLQCDCFFELKRSFFLFFDFLGLDDKRFVFILKKYWNVYVKVICSSFEEDSVKFKFKFIKK